MLDYNVFKWSWSQRFIVVCYIIAFRLTILNPYAILITDVGSKTYKGYFNILCWATVILLLIGCLYCYGYYRLPFKNFLYGVGGCVLANIFFLLVSYAKDKRVPTGTYIWSIVFVAITCGLVIYDSMMYKYYDKED